MFARQPEMKILAERQSRFGPNEFASTSECRWGRRRLKSFPDGETYVRIEENIRGHDVFIVQPTCPPTNQHLMELLIMVDAARRQRGPDHGGHSFFRICATGPQRSAAGADYGQLVANLLNAAGVHRVLTMDLHAQQVQGFFSISRWIISIRCRC